MKLKTLKDLIRDLEKEKVSDFCPYIKREGFLLECDILRVFLSKLKAEAIKWVKEDIETDGRTTIQTLLWIK